MNEKKAKEIRQYTALRFEIPSRKIYRGLKTQYLKASKEQQAVFDSEMKKYKTAIEQGDIKKGDALPTVKVNKFTS